MIYICGKYSRLPHLYALAKFNATERLLTDLGVPADQIINPVKIVPEGTDWQTAMDKYCLPAVRTASAVFAQRDYVDSIGARIEVAEANIHGVPVYYEGDFELEEIIKELFLSRDKKQNTSLGLSSAFSGSCP